MKTNILRILRSLMISAIFGVPIGKIVYDLTNILGLSLFIACVTVSIIMLTPVFRLEEKSKSQVTES